MNILYTILAVMKSEGEPLYVGEIVAVMDYSKDQIIEALFTLCLVGWVKEQSWMKQTRYFYNYG